MVGLSCITKIAARVVGRFLLGRNKRVFPLWLRRLVSFRSLSIQIDVSSVEKPENLWDWLNHVLLWFFVTQFKYLAGSSKGLSWLRQRTEIQHTWFWSTSCRWIASPLLGNRKLWQRISFHNGSVSKTNGSLIRLPIFTFSRYLNLPERFSDFGLLKMSH